jgi:hypothetical protein
MQGPAIFHHNLRGLRALGSAVEAYPCPCPTLCQGIAPTPADLKRPRTRSCGRRLTLVS